MELTLSPVILNKQCKGCYKVHPINHYGKQSVATGKLKSRCKDCNRESLYAWRLAHPDRFRKVGWAYELRKLYGITVADYEQMLLNQGGVCAICGKINTRQLKLAVDHNHKTGKIRGLLCDRCNRGIGLLLNTTNLTNAINYLKDDE